MLPLAAVSSLACGNELVQDGIRPCRTMLYHKIPAERESETNRNSL
jgi:hypothetical protein